MNICITTHHGGCDSFHFNFRATDVERSLLNEGQNHNYEKKRNTGNEQVQKYGQKRHESQITIVISG